MKAKNCTVDDLKAALDIVNEKYDGNIRFNRLDKAGRQVNFTLKVASSKGPGHRLGFPDFQTGKQKRLACACWHVHGDFFDALFKVNPAAAVRSGISSLARPGKVGWITKDGGNWQDKQIGSYAYPLMFSDACDCGPEEALKRGKVVMMKQSDIMKCPFYILDASHYRKDGTCKCNDPKEREKMIREWEYTPDDFKKAGLI